MSIGGKKRLENVACGRRRDPFSCRRKDIVGLRARAEKDEGKTSIRKRNGRLPLQIPCVFALFLVPGHDCFHGALIGAGPAVGTKLGVDLVFLFSLTDRLSRTFTFARAAGDALIRDYVCHFLLSLSFLLQVSGKIF